MSESFSSELLSHPDKKLVNHLADVSAFCKETIAKKKLNFSPLNQATLETIGYILGVCHDFGKSTQYFQDYIRETDPKRKSSLKNQETTNHGRISAIFTYFVLTEFIKEKKEKLWYLPIFGYLIVKRHHGNLKNPAFELVELNEEAQDVLEKQIESIDLPKIVELYRILLPEINVKKFCDIIQIISKDIRKSKRQLSEYLGHDPSLSNYLLFQLLYSSLINADKMEASDLGLKTRRDVSPFLVDNYRELRQWNESKDKMDKIRNEIYNEVTRRVEDINLEKRIYSLNVPTGTGKTLTALSFALKLRERIKNHYGYTPRILYSLPFLSVIDQNFSVFDTVFKDVEGKFVTTDILLKHHHLSDVLFSSGDDEYTEDKALLLIEGWNSEIVVTTFVQFFHSMLSNKNRSLRKFHNLANSVIILDEVQSIPHEYWLLLKDMISAVSDHFNTYFVFVTATQPLIFDKDAGEITELVRDKKKYFDQFDRIELQYSPDELPFDEFMILVENCIEEKYDKNFLIILNTINSTRQLYQHLISKRREDTEYYYLSTGITPKERLDRINEIKASLKRKVIVSTQMIEAGVDIDVDIVYRDMAPLDSINQVAGRCNRNYHQDQKGEVKVFTLNDGKQNFFKYIYSGFLIDKTREVLKNTNKIHENQFLDLNYAYFQKVKESKSDDRAKEILGCVHALMFESIQKEFHLIANEYEKCDIFVELDDTAHKIWQKYLTLQDISPLERRREFLTIKKQFYDYVISVPKTKAGPLMNEELGIGYISRDELKIWYDPKTGFYPNDGGVIIL